MFKLRNFEIEALNMENADHYTLANKLQKDKKTQDYISRDIIKWIEEPKTETFETGKTYVIIKNSLSIGMFGTKKLKEDGNLEMWYDLSPSHRDKGNGERFVGEITPFLIEMVQGLEDIELRICKSNKASNKIATKNGYMLNHSELDTNVYYYFNEETVENPKKM